jgi:hypothetical protein
MRTNLRFQSIRLTSAPGWFSDTGRTDEAQNRAFAVRVQATHSQVFEYSLLNVLQPVVLVVEDFLGVRDVKVVFGALAPRNAMR